MSSIALRTFTDVFGDARSFLNDVAASVYTNTVLLPFGAMAHGEIQDEFAKNGIPILETVSTAFSYVAGDQDIDIPVSVTDLQAPLEIWEQDTSNGLWEPMGRVLALPAPTDNPVGFLGIWEWRNGSIRVMECSSNRNILVRYRRQLAYPAVGSATGGEGFYWPLVLGTAYMAAEHNKRPERAKELAPKYYKRLRDAIEIAVRDLQRVSFRQGTSRRGRYPFPHVTS